jgi:hypothetical protein
MSLWTKLKWIILAVLFLICVVGAWPKDGMRHPRGRFGPATYDRPTK